MEADCSKRPSAITMSRTALCCNLGWAAYSAWEAKFSADGLRSALSWYQHWRVRGREDSIPEYDEALRFPFLVILGANVQPRVSSRARCPASFDRHRLASL